MLLKANAVHKVVGEVCVLVVLAAWKDTAFLQRFWGNHYVCMKVWLCLAL